MLVFKMTKDQFPWEKSWDYISFEIQVFKCCVIQKIKNYCYKNYETIWKPNWILRAINYRIIFVNEYKNWAIENKNEVC